MFHCSCENQLDALEIDKFPPEFMVSPKDLDHKDDGWILLLQCSDCESIWQVDRWDKHQVSLCIRIEYSKNWQKFDCTEVRKKYISTNRGGKSIDICRWKDCNKRAIKGMAFCEECAYEKMGVRN